MFKVIQERNQSQQKDLQPQFGPVSPGLGGATLSNTFHVAGGTNTSTNFDSILSWDPVAEKRCKLGNLERSQVDHGVTTVAIHDIEEVCK